MVQGAKALLNHQSGSLLQLALVAICSLSSLSVALGSSNLAKVLCRDEQSFRSCYGFTLDECLAEADEASRECMERLPPPPRPESIDDLGKPDDLFSQWSNASLYCGEETFEKKNRARMKQDADCATLLKNRQMHRLENPSRYKAHRSGGIAKVLVRTFTPVLAGTLVIFFYLRTTGRQSRIRWTHGALSWFLFMFTAFSVELLLHALAKPLFSGIGDNPGQIAGLLIAMPFSVPINLAVWIGFRHQQKKSKTFSL